MKKALSLFLVVLMLIGMVPLSATHAHAAEVSETITVAASSGTVSGESISWTSGNLTFTANKNTSSNAIRTSDTDHFRLYVGFSATLTCSAGNITKIVMTATGSSYAVAPTGSDGSVGTVAGTTITIVPNESSNTYTIPSIGAQTRIKTIAVTYATVDSAECAHANTEEIAAVDPTCTVAGNTAGIKCTDCGTTLEGNETIAATGHTETSETTAPTCTEDGYTTYTCSVCGNKRKSDWVDATGHSYVDGVCSACNLEQPTGLAGKYYIAAIRSSGNYIYMTNDLGTASTNRYQIVDSGLTELPASITEPVDAQIFELVFDTATVTYKIKTGDQYLGWTTGNSGTLVDEASAIAATIDAAADGAYNIHFAASDAERYLALNSNSTSNYFAWYKKGQAENLHLIPVAESEACQHANVTTTTVEATCGADGSVTIVCDDCGATVSTEVLPKTDAHNFVDGACSVCGISQQDWEGAIDPTDPPAEEGGYELATDIIVGDTVIIVAEDVLMELSSFSTYGIGAAYTDVPAGTMTWTVEEGTVSGSYAFKNGDGNYLYWSSGNTLNVSATKDAQASWNVSFDNNDVILANAGTVDVARHVVWNNSSPRFANYKDSSINTTNYSTIQFYKYVSSDACTHEWGAWVETTAATCTAAGVETATCTLCSATKTQPIAATGHSLVYGETAITCENCDYSQAYTLSPISDAKAYTDGTQVYYVKGIVTYVSGNKIYIEDNSGALLVVFNGEDGAGIALGDEILVWDTMTTYNGLIETTYTTVNEYVKVSEGNALPSQEVTIAALLADTTNEYLSERVVIKNVTIGTINTSGNTALTDADGNSINIYKVSGLNADINANDTVDVTAILSTYNGYQLLINPDTAATDVVEVVAGEEEVVTTVTIAEAKAGTAGEYYQVEGVVTYVSGRNVYIQDSTGGIVVYLAANAANTNVGDNVRAYGALKVYNGLIELDAVDETNAEFYQVLSNNNTVDAQSVTIAGLLADSTNDYLAEKITLTDVYVSHYSYSSSYMNVTYYLNDGNGNEIQVYRVAVASEEDCIPGGSIVTVEAVVSTYNGYQLVTTNDKIVKTAECAHETTELVNVAEATCTVDGYTGDTKCVVCQYYVTRGETVTAPGHTEVVDAAVAADCENTGLTEGSHCSVCNEVIVAQEEVAALGHTEAETIYPPTCEDMGYTQIYCTVCGKNIQIEDEVPALGHSYESVVTPPAIGVQGYTTHTCTVCGDSYVDSYTDPLPEEVVLPSGNAELKFAAASITLESDLSVTFKVKQEVYDAFENVRVEFKLGQDGTVNVAELDSVDASGRSCYVFSGIAAKQVNDWLYATVYGTYEGQEYSYTSEYNIAAKYCTNMLGKETTSAELKTLLVDLINYGTAAQRYFDYNVENLAVDNLTDEQKALGTSAVPTMEAFANGKYEEVSDPKAQFTSISLVLESKVVTRCKAKFLTTDIDLSKVTLEIRTLSGDSWSIPYSEWTETSGIYSADFSGLAARQMRERLLINICEDGVPVSNTLLQGVENYCAKNSVDGNSLQEITIALMRYVDAANAFFS